MATSLLGNSGNLSLELICECGHTDWVARAKLDGASTQVILLPNYGLIRQERIASKSTSRLEVWIGRASVHHN